MSQAIKDYQRRQEQFNQALASLRCSLRTEEQLCDLLYCISSTLAEANGDDLLAEDVTLIDSVADVINYRTRIEVELMIDAVESITLSEETE